MIVAGWRRALEISDLWSLNPRYKSQSVAPQLAKAWQRELDKSGLANIIVTITSIINLILSRISFYSHLTQGF